MKQVVVVMVLLAGAIALVVWRSVTPGPAPRATVPSPAAASGEQPGSRVDPGGEVSQFLGHRERAPQPGSAEYRAFYREMSRKDPFFAWKRPLDFYGLVLDERGTPVEGATAKCIWNDLSSKGTSTAEVHSDRDGRFVLARRRGKGLSVKVEKAGYYTQWTGMQFSFEYANPFEPNFHVPDPAAPVVFRLRKKGKAQPVKLVERSFLLPRDGTTVNLDLVTGKVCAPEAVHLRVECWNSREERHPPRPYDWRARISIPGGGLIVHDEEFPFEAPLDGYVEALEIGMPAALDRAWVSQVDRKFVARLRDQTYVRIQLGIRPFGDHFFKIVPHLNPSGSRNLEYDPDAQPRDQR